MQRAPCEAGLAVPVLAGDGDSGAPDGASVDQPVNTGDCSCTARHETLTRQAIERYYAGELDTGLVIVVLPSAGAGNIVPMDQPHQAPTQSLCI